MDKLILFPMNRTEKGVVLQAMDTTQLGGTQLVFVDRLRARMLGINPTNLWVEAVETEGKEHYPEFCAENAIELDGCRLAPYTNTETGEAWLTQEGKQWYGVVTT